MFKPKRMIERISILKDRNKRELTAFKGFLPEFKENLRKIQLIDYETFFPLLSHERIFIGDFQKLYIKLYDEDITRYLDDEDESALHYLRTSITLYDNLDVKIRYSFTHNILWCDYKLLLHQLTKDYKQDLFKKYFNITPKEIYIQDLNYDIDY